MGFVHNFDLNSQIFASILTNLHVSADKINLQDIIHKEIDCIRKKVQPLSLSEDIIWCKNDNNNCQSIAQIFERR